MTCLSRSAHTRRLNPDMTVQMHYVLVDAICAAANWGDAVLMRMSSKTPNARLPPELDTPARLLLNYVVRRDFC